LLIIEKWPCRDTKFCVPTIDGDFKIIQEIIKAIRNARAEYKIEPSKKIDAVIYAGKVGNKNFCSLQSQEHLIKNLRTGIDKLEIKEKGAKIKNAVYLIVDDVEIYLTGIIDEKKEKKNLEKEIDNLKKYLSQIKSKLKNKGFIANAPAVIVEKEREKYKESENKLKKLKKKIESLL
jgi:valyl-tRNA synthetase